MLQKICVAELDVIVEAGYVKPITSINLSNRFDVTNAIKLHYGLLRCKAELDQLHDGLSIMGVREAMTMNSDLFSPLFTSSEMTKLTAGTCMYYILLNKTVIQLSSVYHIYSQ